MVLSQGVALRVLPACCGNNDARSVQLQATVYKEIAYFWVLETSSTQKISLNVRIWHHKTKKKFRNQIKYTIITIKEISN